MGNEQQQMRIVIMGGSFNPPTIAHWKLLKAAVEDLQAQKGIFIPVSHAYLKRKMRGEGKQICFSEQMRYKMLLAMCKEDDRLTVNNMEFQSVKAQTYHTMERIQKLYPDADLYFLIGSDKLQLMETLGEHSDFLKRFRVAVFCRNGIESWQQQLTNRKHLELYKDSFVFLPTPEGIETVSSTMVRRQILSGESSKELLYPAVWEIVRNMTADNFPEEIKQFKGNYEFLSNRYPVPVTWEGLTYKCAEAAFQASKLSSEKERIPFTKYNADKAKYCGMKISVSDKWEKQKVLIMEQIVVSKFAQNSELTRRLLETNNMILINGTNKTDDYWGVNLYSWQGENYLGKILMKVRSELKRGNIL